MWRFLVLCVFPSVSSSCVFLLNLHYSRVCVSLFTSSFSLKLFVSCIPLYFPSCLLVMDCSHLCDYPHLCLIPLDSSTSLITLVYKSSRLSSQSRHRVCFPLLCVFLHYSSISENLPLFVWLLHQPNKQLAFCSSRHPSWVSAFVSHSTYEIIHINIRIIKELLQTQQRKKVQYLSKSEWRLLWLCRVSRFALRLISVHSPGEESKTVHAGWGEN